MWNETQEKIDLRQKIAQAKLYCITCPPRNRQSYQEMVKAACEGGADIIQLREKNLSAAELVKLGKDLSTICHQYGTIFIVNDRVDVALACEADGVHLGQDDLPIKEARKIANAHLSTDFIIGCSTHSPEQAHHAQRAGADYLACGPIFSTPTKPDYPAVGINLIRQYRERQEHKIPLVAIGGIEETNVEDVIRAGADCVAVVRAVFGQDNIENAARSLKRKIETALLVNVKK